MSISYQVSGFLILYFCGLIDGVPRTCCDKNMVVSPCFRTWTENSCYNLKNPTNNCSTICVPDTCVCKPGLVRNDCNKCVTPDKCSIKCELESEPLQCIGQFERVYSCLDPVQFKVCPELRFSKLLDISFIWMQAQNPLCKLNTCDCIDGYLRNKCGECVPINECGRKCCVGKCSQCSGPNEVRVKNYRKCAARTCENFKHKKKCKGEAKKSKKIKKNVCDCKRGYRRDKCGRCVLKNQCHNSDPCLCTDPCNSPTQKREYSCFNNCNMRTCRNYYELNVFKNKTCKKECLFSCQCSITSDLWWNGTVCVPSNQCQPYEQTLNSKKKCIFQYVSSGNVQAKQNDNACDNVQPAPTTQQPTQPAPTTQQPTQPPPTTQSQSAQTNPTTTTELYENTTSAFVETTTISQTSFTDTLCPLNSTGLIEYYEDYTTKTHYVQTEDGYILTVFELDLKKNSTTANKKCAVILAHGLISSSDDFLSDDKTKGTNKTQGIAYFLANAGHKVYVPNFRGNFYSRNHTTLETSDPRFWNFSYYEMATYDYPALINYVLDQTGDQTLCIVGHSQGNSALMALLSLLPSYNDKVAAASMLAPVGYWNNSVEYATLAKTYPFFELINYRGIFPRSAANAVGGSFCNGVENLPVGFCEAFFNTLFGPSENENNKQCNYGFFGPYMYNSTVPNDYNFSNIRTPLTAHASPVDAFTNPKDYNRLFPQLKSLLPEDIQIMDKNLFNHFDFFWGKSAPREVYPKITTHFDKYFKG